MNSIAYSSTNYGSALPQGDASGGKLFTQLGVAIFVIGIASAIPLQTVGRLFIGELFLIGLAPIVVLLLLGVGGQYGKTARMLLVAMFVSWMGYLVSDIVRGTPSSDYLRGWSRWIAIGASFSTLAWLGSKNINFLLAFLLGQALGGCVAPLVLGGYVGPVYYWKFHASVPVCFAALILVRKLSAWASVGVSLALALVSIALDTRSIALLCMLTAGITFLAHRRRSGNRPLSAPVSKTQMFAAGVAVAALLGGAVWLIQYLGSHYGYARRFEASNATRMASATVAWSAIKESPVIGYGSWPRDPHLARERDKIVAKAKGVPTMRGSSQEDLIIAHSQILQGWLEGGLLGLFFFALLGAQIVRLLNWQSLVSPYMMLTPVSTFMVLECAWNLVFSPFSGTQRLGIPVACVFICYATQKMVELRTLQSGAYAPYSFGSFRPALHG